MTSGDTAFQEDTRSRHGLKDRDFLTRLVFIQRLNAHSYNSSAVLGFETSDNPPGPSVGVRRSC